MTLRRKHFFPAVIASAAAVFMILLYLAKDVQGSNPYFILGHIIILVFTSAVFLYCIREEELSLFAYKKIFQRVFVLLFAVSIILLIFFLIRGWVYGSMVLVSAIAIVSGVLLFYLINPLKDREKVDLSTYLGNTVKEITSFRPRLDASLLVYLTMIFLMAFILRYCVFGLPLIPLGYDAPDYLLLAAKGSQMGWTELTGKAFSFSGDLYEDNWNFAYLWLGGSVKILNIFGLDTLRASKIIMPFISSLCIIPIFLLARSITDNKNAALFSALVFAMLPTELIFSDLYKETFGELILIFSLYFFAEYFRRRSFIPAVFLIVSLLLSWKVAITVAAKIFLFLLAYTTYLALSGRVKKIDFSLGLVFVLLPGILFFLYAAGGFELGLTKAEDPGIYTQYAFPILALTSFTGFLISVLLFMKLFFSKPLSSEEKGVFPLAGSLMFGLFLYSFMISGLLSYRIFPSTTLLDGLRFALYMDIAIALFAGVFLYTLLFKLVNKRRGLLLVSILFVLLLSDFYLTASSGTTIHGNRLQPYIDTESYDLLESLDYASFGNIYYSGNFEWEQDTKNYAYGNWIRYIVYDKTGREPILINISDLDVMPIASNSKSVVLYYDGAVVEPHTIERIY